MNSAPSDSASVVSGHILCVLPRHPSPPRRCLVSTGSKVLFAVKSMGPTATSCAVPCSQCYWWPRINSVGRCSSPTRPPYFSHASGATAREQTDTRPRRPTRSRNLEAPFTSTRIMISCDEEDVLKCSMAGHRSSDRGSGSRIRDSRDNRSGDNDDDSGTDAEGDTPLIRPIHSFTCAHSKS
ncbi:hypothetical protein BC827DRAFT_225008 [Russula dissimulans]|nr:hypothetical protein BC827DRAFT_225008 [Russula dissimulans]